MICCFNNTFFWFSCSSSKNAVFSCDRFFTLAVFWLLLNLSSETPDWIVTSSSSEKVTNVDFGHVHNSDRGNVGSRRCCDTGCMGIIMSTEHRTVFRLKVLRLGSVADTDTISFVTLLCFLDKICLSLGEPRFLWLTTDEERRCGWFISGSSSTCWCIDTNEWMNIFGRFNTTWGCITITIRWCCISLVLKSFQ